MLVKIKEDVMDYSYCQRTSSVSSTFIVKASESDKDSYFVDLNGEMMFRGNKSFSSTWIICGHICRAVQEVGPHSFGAPGDPRTVHPYFLLYTTTHYGNLFASTCHFQASTHICQIITMTFYTPLNLTYQTVMPKMLSYQ
jgi:hypothetical protein